MSTETAAHDGEPTVEDCIEQAATSVGSAWPLHSFVTANPLSGFEDRPFHEAVGEADRLFGADGYPSVDVFRAAWEAGRIDPGILDAEITGHGYHEDAETLLDQLETEASDSTDNESPDSPAVKQVDHLLTKWLAAFLDQGQTEWPMPNREQGFYAAFRTIARHDTAIPNRSAIAGLPEEPLAAIETILADSPREQYEAIFETQFAALPGWVGLIKQQAETAGDWQSTYPITLADYLAVRLAVADQFDAPLASSSATESDEIIDERVPLAEVWLTAWERSYREELVESVSAASASLAEGENSDDSDTRPDAQLVFCIDTRSEIIRRHIESTGNYETHGYAGFFGVPMRYKPYESDVTIDACPPIVEPTHRVADRPACGHGHSHDHEHNHGHGHDHEQKQTTHDRWTDALHGGKKVLKKLKSNAATAYSFVETAGAGYGAALAGRTLLPGRVADLLSAADKRVPDDHEFCEPSVDYNPDSVNELREGFLLDEKVEFAKTAFELMGIETFGRLFVFTGHGSHTSNNPFDSSLDCGACAGNHGGPNARVLAAICNDETVRDELRADGFDIPADTVFVAGEHNTTTDEISLYTSTVPESHSEDIQQLQADLETAREGSANERATSMGADADGDGVDDTKRRAADWAETRPEWGLAGNASFVIGPRELTADSDLDGRAFLHSYDWSTDPDGDALAAIIAGPMIVTQWINNQYYFATVDTAAFGSGSKITHNPVGNVGVYQGNGGDILTGLPLQSVKSADDEPYHQPLRLSTVIHAPVQRVTDILSDNEEVTQLLDNGWLSLTVVDPVQDHHAFDYAGDLSWTKRDHTELQPERKASPTVTAAD